jgi:methionyl-tRNA synthetase
MLRAISCCTNNIIRQPHTSDSQETALNRYLITSALPYASGITHLGNVVGSTLPADVYARYCRLRGRETLYVCGSDEHGVAITIAAEREGITPQQLIDRYHEANKRALASLAIDFDIYDRTSNPIHKQTAQEFFLAWRKQGLLVEREEDQFFDPTSNIFLPDRYVEGICPNCGYDKARGDQCDNCGAYYNQLDLKQPRSLVSGQAPEVRKTKHWYFRLDAFQEWTERYIEDHAGLWKDNVLQQSRSWLKQGLAERAATRDMRWGIPVPLDGAQGKVLYVWFEAVLGYISATKQWALDNGNTEAWKTWWCNEDTQYTAFLGKDNIVFHTIIFPILLHTRSSEGYVLPTNIPANEFLNLEGQKFSKSRNWAIDVEQFLADMPEPYHVDALRYTLVMNMPETKDSDFTWRDFQSRVNNELAAILGNLVNRVLLFAHKNFDGRMPPVDASLATTEHEETLHRAIAEARQGVADAYDRFRFRDAATETMNLARAANKYFNDKAPWKSVASNPQDCARSIAECLNVTAILSTIIAPILPITSAAIQRMLGMQVCTGAVGGLLPTTDVWLQGAPDMPKAGHTLGQATILFTKIEDSTVEQQIAKLGPTPAAQQDESNEPAMPLIDIDQFGTVQLRTAVIVEAEAVPKSKKLVRLQVDLGTERRQVLAGIALHYTPEQLVGKTVVVVANLKPATLMGLESQGMILAASNADGMLTLVTPSDVAVGPGAVVK